MIRNSTTLCLAGALWLLLLLAASPITISAQDTSTSSGALIDSGSVEPEIVYDSSSFEPRSISEEDIENYLDDSDFDYSERKPRPDSIFDQILEWLYELFAKIFGDENGQEAFQYAILIGAVILILVLLSRSELRGLISRRVAREKEKGVVFDEFVEDVTRMDFDTLIAEAVAQGNLRRAVRLRYLKLLRSMTEADLIEWRPEKTNGDYLRELSIEELRPGFAELTRIFDFVWYGGFEIDRERYNRIGAEFDVFARRIEAAG